MRRPLVSITLLLVALVALPCMARAAAVPQWVQQHYGVADGMPVGSARDAAIGADGFLWLATQDGLVRFDGRRFSVFDAMRVPGMTGNRAMTVDASPSGTLYAVTKRGDLLRIRGGSVTSLHLGSGPQAAVLGVDPHDLCATTSRAFYCLDAAGDYALRVHFPDGLDVALAVSGLGDSVWMMTDQYQVWVHRDGTWRKVWQPTTPIRGHIAMFAAVATDGALWTTFNNHVLRISATGTAHYFDAPDAPFGVGQMDRSDDGLIWIGAGNGAFVAGAGDAPPRALSAHPMATPGMSWRVQRAPDGALWASHGNQLWRIEPAGDAAIALPSPVLSTSKAISQVRFGPGDLVWVTTGGDGLYRLNHPRVATLGPAAGLSNGVYSVSHAIDGSMWLGTLGHGVYAVHADGRIDHYGVAAGLANELSWLVACAPDGSVYTASHGSGLWRLAPGADRFVAVALPEALRLRAIRAVTFDQAGDLWLGTTDGAWRRHGGQWQRMWPSTTVAATVFDVLLTADGTWYATNRGLWYQRAGQTRAVAPQLLGDVTVRNVQRSRDGTLWVSTVGHGLVRIAAADPSGRQPLQLGRLQGLPSNSPHTVREDAAGNIWVNSNHGVFRISPVNLRAYMSGERPELSPLVLGESDGLTVLEGNGGIQPAAAWDARGRLWFPSQGGVVRFDPMATRPRGQAPRVVITGIQSQGRAVPLADDGSLPRGVRNLRIDFGAANLFGDGDSQFRYRLLPNAQGWTGTRTTHSAEFTGLVPGSYRFELMAANSDGVWTRTPTVLAFNVPAYWYERLAVRVLAVVAVLALGLLLVRLRLQGLRRIARELNRQVRERTAELSNTNARLERANIALADAASHDFLTGLPNRRTFVAAVNKAIEAGGPMAMAFLDIDYFKAYNDSLGHAAGDACLARFAGLLQQLGGSSGVLAARVGGEEFTLLFEGDEVETAGDALDGLIVAVRALALRHPASTCADYVSFSAGLAVRGANDQGADDLFRRADAALYRAKRAGRNRWVRATASAPESSDPSRRQYRDGPPAAD